MRAPACLQGCCPRLGCPACTLGLTGGAPTHTQHHAPALPAHMRLQVRRFGRNGIQARTLQVKLEDQNGTALGAVRVLVGHPSVRRW